MSLESGRQIIDMELVARAQAGCPDAMHDLIAILRPMIFKYCYARLARFAGGADIAEDVAQETCMAVCLVLPRYEDQGRPFTSWVYAIAAHKVADAQRGFFARPATPIDEVPDLAEPSATPEERMIASLDIRVTNELIAKLPNKTRELLLLRVAGHSAEDVAERLDMTPGAVRVAHHRAITKLRQLATEAEPEEPPPIASQTQLNSVA